MSDGYLYSKFQGCNQFTTLKNIILAKMRRRSEFERLQEFYEHDAMNIILNKILRLVDRGFRIRYRDIKATVISAKIGMQSKNDGKMTFTVEKLQVKIKKHYFRCKLRHFPYCPWCGHKPRSCEVINNIKYYYDTHGEMISACFLGSNTYFKCFCGCYYHLDYGVYSAEGYFPLPYEPNTKFVELVKKRFKQRFPPIPKLSELSGNLWGMSLTGDSIVDP